YGEGETMIISGSGFTANAAVNISVLRPDHLTDYLSAVANSIGSFQASYTPSAPAVLGRYKITATDGTNSATTASTEADASYSLTQCAQNDSKQGQPLGLGYCNWIGSSLGQQNSLLYEAIATEQQLLITGIANPNGSSTVHTLIVGIQATKGGKHTYDWLVSDAQASGTVGASTLNSEQASALAQITLQLNRCGDSLGTTDQAACSALVAGATASNTVDIDVPDDPFVSKDGNTQTKITNYETGVPSSTCKFCGFGNRTVRLYTNAPVSNQTMALEHRGGKLSGAFGDGSTLADNGDTGDSFIWYKITWTGSASSAMLAAGADVVYGSDGTGRSWGANVGATDVGGDPYHFYLIGFDGDGGSQDNQMSSNAVFTIPTRLTLHKVVVNDNGGTAVATDWMLSATGPTNISGTDGSANVTSKTVNPGTYNLSESGGPSGYTNGTTYSCVLNGAAPVPGNSITLADGDTAVCTITNDDIAPTLTLVKNVVNDNGGTSLASAWTLTATGTGGFSGSNGTLSNNSLTQTLGPKTVNANVAYSLSESGPSGYAASAWTCVGGTQSGSNITLAVGGSATCTITNDDTAPTLTLVKNVVNDNGGTSLASAWTLTATGSGGFSGNNGTLSNSNLTQTLGPKTVTANVAYALSESGPSGYSASAWTCVGGTQSGSNITLAVGGSATCTITNNDNGPTLTLVKNVVNGNSGTALASAWTLTATGTGGFSGNNGSLSNSNLTQTLGPKTVNANVAYALSESGPGGYSASGWTCVGGTQSGSNITLTLGGSATCTITNTALSRLTVQKTIQGNSAIFNFDTTSPNNFLPASISATPPNNSTAASAQANGLIIPAGDYAISESLTGMNGWLLTDKSCTGITFSTSATGVSFTAAYGQNIVCTFINDQQAGSVTRTQGFWATHTILANDIWNGTPLPPKTSTLTPGKVAGNGDDFFSGGVCGVNGAGFTITALTTTEENIMMGGFWAAVSQTTSKGGKRSPIDQARLQALQQYLAAVLNTYAFGTPFTSIYGGFAQFRADYCGTNANNISRWIGPLGTFNTKGDSSLFTPGASATSQDSKNQADIDAWDTPTNPVD
ncbi:MAG: hypothetical protein JWO19_3989, partial [Bryobacterales bacterium]|nr:hypothetical protein [Bryobacterales bacterium]